MNLSELSAVLVCTHTIITGHHILLGKGLFFCTFLGVILENILETSFNLTMTQFPAEQND